MRDATRRGRELLGVTVRRPAYLLGWTLLGGVVAASLFGPFLNSSDPSAADLSRRLTAPSLANPFGTDALGRDLLSRILHGGRISLLVGFGATALAACVGSLSGLVSGYLGGRARAVIMGIADAQLAFPFVLLAIVVAAAVGTDLVNLTLILALSSVVVFARAVDGLVLSLKHEEFVVASVATGVTTFRILVRHLLPHAFPVIVVLASLQLGRIILLESALSFLGLGVPPQMASWGATLSDARPYIQVSPWLPFIPGAAITLTVLGTTLVGDWLNESSAPRGKLRAGG